MPQFRHSIDIDATPDQVWSVLGDLAGVDRWIPGITAVSVDGTHRTCSFQDGHIQNEHILDYSPQARSYRYRIEGAPLPVTDNIGSFTVEDVDGTTTVVWQSSFAALDPAMAEQLAQMWQPYLPMVLANLKTTVESSVRPPHPPTPSAGTRKPAGAVQLSDPG
jgi:carbon monoxide dehydrogenase subunit G